VETISTADVRAGDVLLFHGDSFVSWAIRKIDGSEVNHVAIALGDGRLAEAGGHGLQQRAIPAAFNDTNYMLVRRYPSADVKPVLSTAHAYLDNGNFYAYQQIVLLAVLGLTRRIPARGLTRRLIRSACDHAARALMDLLPMGASWMICSEFVFRCFDEASNAVPDPFDLLIAGADYGSPVFGESSWTDWALENAEDTVVTGAVSFDLGGFDPDEAERDLAPLIAEWAAHVGVDERDPLPDSAETSLSFGVTEGVDADSLAEAQKLDVPDEELRRSMLVFSEALKTARATTPGVPVSFGLVGATVAGAAVKGALKGLHDMTVDANFVTPRDLLMSSSLGEVKRAT
jgi:hypothetical protein